MEKSMNPLRTEAPKEIPLDNAPLIRVIGQIRFPLVESINDGKPIAPFQEEVKGSFPVLRKDVLPGLIVTPAGLTQGPEKTIWRFSNIEETWRLSLAPDFVAIETTKYVSRTDFLSRLRTVYGIVNEHFGISIIDRIGLRYIDRITVTEIEDVLRLISPEATGILSTPLAADAELVFQENVLKLPEVEGKLRARWGVLPPNSTVDPSAIEPSPDQTWILDLDAYSTPKKAYTEDEMVALLDKFAEKSYSVFRWIVTDEFLNRYGGKV